MKTIRVFPHPSQRGHGGLGGLFSSLARMILPIGKTALRASKPLIKTAAKSIGKEALQMGVETVSDLVQGGDLKSSVKKNAKAGAKRIFKKAEDGIQKTINKRKKSGYTSFENPPRKSSAAKGKKKKKKKTIFD